MKLPTIFKIFDYGNLNLFDKSNKMLQALGIALHKLKI